MQTVTLNGQDYLNAALSETTNAFAYLLQLAKFATTSKAEVLVANRIVDVENPIVSPHSISVEANGYQFVQGKGFKQISKDTRIPQDSCSILTVSYTLPESTAVQKLLNELKKFNFFYFS